MLIIATSQLNQDIISNGSSDIAKECSVLNVNFPEVREIFASCLIPISLLSSCCLLYFQLNKIKFMRNVACGDCVAISHKVLFSL